MSDPYRDLVAGVVVCQELLVRHLEEQGIIEKGAYTAALKEHLANVAPVRRDQVMYGPMKALIETLSKPAPVAVRKH